MRVGLHITTYNNVSNLELVMSSIAVQKHKPDEILILDDGSSGETVDLINSIRCKFPNLKHVRQEDQGFRLARIRNLGILTSTADYIISIDGDMVLHQSFIHNHLKSARKGFFIQGTRQRLNKKLSDKLLKLKRNPSGLEKFLGRDTKNKSRLWGIHLPFLFKILSREYESPKKIMGCNQSFFRNDLLAVNGYSNSFVGWGEEDYELVFRMFKFGLKEIHMRYSAIAWHLYHPEKKRVNDRNQIPTSHYKSSNGLEELREEITSGRTGKVTCNEKPLSDLLKNPDHMG